MFGARENGDSKIEFGTVSKIVVAVKLPTGATEIIINTEDIKSKYESYCNAYDDDMCLKSNPNISIVNWMFV